MPTSKKLGHRTIFIDFDKTISPNEPDAKKLTEPPYPDAVECINRLHECGDIIVIHSERGNSELTGDVELAKERMRQMIQYLDLHNIPYSGLALNKPYYSISIDDKNIAFNPEDKNSWSRIKKDLIG